MQLNPLSHRVKPWMIQSFLTLTLWTEPSSETIHWKAVEQYFTVVLFVFQLHPVCNFIYHFLNTTATVTIHWKAVEQYVTVVLFVFQKVNGQFLKSDV